MKILVIDDENLTRHAVVDELNGLGYHDIIESSNGSEGYAMILDEQPQIVIADIRMPGMDGIQLLHKIRTDNIDTIYIVLSGYDLFQYAKSALDDGAFAYLLKPVDRNEFEAVLSAAGIEIERRESINREHQKLHNHYMQSRHALINQFLSDAVFRQAYTIEEFKNKAAQLELLFPHDCYFIAIIRVLLDHSYCSAMKTNPLVLEAVKFAADKLAAHHIVNYSFSTQDDTCLICNYSGADNPAFSEIMDIFHTVEYECRKQISSNVFIGISRPCMISEWQNGYHAARNVIDSQILTSRAAQDSKSSKSNAGNLLKDDQKQILIQYMTENRIDALDSCLDMIFAPFFYDLKDDSHARNNFCLYIIMLCMNILDERKLDPTQLLGDEFELYREACALKNAAESLDWIRQKLHLCAQKFASGNDAAPKPDMDNISEIEKFIQTNFAVDLSLKTVAEHFHYTSSYLSRMFKEKTGLSFIKFLNHCRFSEAKRLLIGTQMQINRVAKQVGFNDYKHFVSEFKRHTGYAPMTYREHFRNLDT